MPPVLLLLLLAALIQVRGEPLNGGIVSGSAELTLEKAQGGDTPVLAFSTARGRLRLLLDTGATSTMVTPQLVQRLGLSSTPLSPAGFALAGGGRACAELRPRRTLLPALELLAIPGSGRYQLRGVEALVLPVAALPPGVDGVLGAPTLRQQPLWIDPLEGRLAFGVAALRLNARGAATLPERPPALAAALSAATLAPEARAVGPARLQLRWRQGVPLLDLRTALGVVPALADTGAEGVFISPALAERLPRLGSGKPLRLVGFCGEQAVEQITTSGLSLSAAQNGTHGLASSTHEKPLPVIVTANPIFQQLGVQAIVGQELLRQRRQLWRLDLEPPQLLLP